MRPTVKDVAALAAVSPKTVSNVLGGTVRVAPDTRARVEHAIERLGYVPNLAARGLRSGRTGLIALVLPDVRSPFSAELVQLVVELAHERALGVQLEQASTSVDRTRELIASARRHLVDGVLLNPATGAQRDAALGGGGGEVPLVMLGEVEQRDVDQVWVDSVDAARRMTAFLIGLGHRRIAMLGVQPPGEGTVTGGLRRQGYREALTEAGLPADPVLERTCAAWTPEGGYDAMTRLLAEEGRPDAVFCATDAIALGALSALWVAGVRVPDDVSVAGFDDVSVGAFAAPPLTTVRWDKRGYAEAALDRLVTRIAGSAEPALRLRFPVEIVRRASVRER
ncbi:LacI family DNA-binding transcriptional regulator [Amnibacterium kyonggiense]|uniref:LacI family transcriptional regulator n=1 Tax=Amnibacterium kyonggiense TaxID=595671 RepID=A0A4R7FQQ5_9MICO|nr:LacI family DNA-binding transcriptional regulator [Amnibacterium kyonggiense]TDS80122.1 LacI family transcriptional regulator [Amnibacterium kyonggiense]